jgi:PAS domain S-box-containing protein
VVSFGLLFTLRFAGWFKAMPKMGLYILLFLPSILIEFMMVARLDTYVVSPSAYWNWVVNPLPTGITYAIHSWISLTAMVMLSLLWLHFFRVKTNKQQRSQAFLLALGVTVPIVGGIVMESIFPLVFRIDYIPLKSPLTAAFSIAALVAIKKYSLLDYSPRHQWNEILENLNEGILIVNRKEEIMHANSAFCWQFGYDFEEIKGMAIRNLFKPGEWPELGAALFLYAMKTGNEIQMSTKDGQVIWVLMGTTPYSASNGEVIGFIHILTDITERKKAELELKKKEAGLNQAQALAHVGSWDLEPGASKVIWSDEECRIFGLDISDNHHTLDSFLSFIHPDDLSFVRDLIEQSKGNEGKVAGEYRIVRHDGSIRYINTETRFEFGENGNPVSAHGIAHDITELKLIQLKRESESQNFMALINNTDDLMWSVDRNLCLITCNKAFQQIIRQITGKEIQPGDCITDPVFTTVQLDRWIQFYERGFSGEVFTEIECNTIPEERWSEVSFYPILKDGIATGTACYSRNITGRKKAEQEIEAKELRYRSLVEQASDAILIADENQRLCEVNTSACNMLGYSKEEFLEVSVIDLAFQEDLKTLPARFNDLKEGKEVRYERRLKRKNGTEIHVEISAKKINGGRNLIFLRDVSEKKKAEERLTAINKDLETFIYKASHDLRGPLASIIGLVNVSFTEITDKNSLKYLEMISQSTARLDKILIGLVQSMNIRDAKVISEPIHFHSLISETLQRLGHCEGYSDISVSYEVNLQSSFVSSRFILESVFQNIIENAIRYRNRRAVPSFLKIGVTESASGIQVVFEDNGIGIEADLHDRIFEMYFRGTAESSGSGLGLYLVKASIHKLGGSIRIESELRIGSRFILFLPFIHEAHAVVA